MSQPDSPITLPTPIMPDVSGLLESYSDLHGFWIKERSTPTPKNEEEVKCNPLSPSLLHVDIARDLRSAQYNRNKAKNRARFAQARELKRQDQPRRGHSTQQSKGGKRSGKRQFITQDLIMDSESDYEQNRSVFPERPAAVFAPVRMREGRPIFTSTSPELQPPTEKSPKGFTPPVVYTTATLPESSFDVLAPDAAREFRSYERHRHQAKKNARFMQSREMKNIRVKPVLGRSSKSVKTENLRSLISLAIVDEGTSSEDEIQTPIEISPSLDVESVGSRAPPAVDMETLVATAKVKYTKGLSSQA